MSGRILTSTDLTADVDVACDVCIIGSGAGGAVLAEGLASRGHEVVILEEGGYHTSRDFDLQESHAFPMLYQERGTRATADLGITILQGRAVGGSTVVNWATCFRTPQRVLDHWKVAHGLTDWTEPVLRPHFEAVEQRLNIHEWPIEQINENNRVLWDGGRKLGYEVTPLRRNVNGCANSGYCGVGCPVNGKQSMLVTYLPDAVAQGATLYANTRADRLETAAGKVTAVQASVLDPATHQPTGHTVRVRAKVTALCGGAINSPVLLLKSGLDDGTVGRRTWLHPVVAMAGLYDREIKGFSGAPQSVASHQFVDRGEGKVGFFLETPPMQPMLASSAFPFHGVDRQRLMAQLPHIGTLIAVCVDGLLPGDPGGTVTVRPDGRPKVDYAISPAMQEAFREAMKVCARIELAAGAKVARSLHVDGAVEIRTEADISKLDGAAYGSLKHAIFTAHQMGGCRMGTDPKTSVIRQDLRHHTLANLYIVGGSVLPTALGVNPSETIYGIAHRAVDFVESGI